MSDVESDDDDLTPKQARFVEEYVIDLNAIRAAAAVGLSTMTTGAPATYYVYGLIDPNDGRLFYVGKGKNKRWHQHYTEKKTRAEGANMHKLACIRRAGGRLCVVFAEGEAEDRAYGIESALVRALATYLTNITPGGTPRHQARDAYRDMLKQVIPFDRWLAKKKRTYDEIAMYCNIVEELKKSAAAGTGNVARFRQINDGLWERVAA